MSESPFGDLLGDFGDSTTSTTSTTTTTKTYGNFEDDFDPFGSSPAHGQTSQGPDSGMLLDFSSYESQIKNGGSGGRVEFHTDNTQNPFSNMSADSQPSNPLYDLANFDSDSQPSKPLYDLGDFDSKSANAPYDLGSEMNSNDSSNLVYEFTSESTTKTQSAGAPQYDAYEVDDTIDEAAEEVDLLSGTNEVQEEEEDEDAGYEQTRQYQYNDSDPEEVHEEENEAEVKVVTLEYQTTALNGDPRHWAGHVSDEEDEQQRRGSDEEQQRRGSDEEQQRRGSDEEQQPRGSDEEQQRRGSDEEQRRRGSDEEDNYTGGVQIIEQEEEVLEGGRTVTRTTRTETSYSGDSRSENRQTSQDFSSNHWDDDRHREHSDLSRQTTEQDVIHFNEMSTTKSKFEAQPSPTPRKQQSDFRQEILSAEGGVYESQPQVVQQWQNEVEEEGVFENQPQKREDVFREADSDKTADLPPVGTAQSLRAKFMSVQQESTSTHTKHDISPSSYSVRGEYVSEPRGYVEKYEGRPESGVFESEPVHIPDVVRSGEEVKEELPEKGMAKNLANMFRQFSTEKTTASHVVKSKREITPDRTTSRVEYVSEPQTHHVNEYDVRVDAGVFENQPHRQTDVVTSDSVPEDYIPERGFAKNVAAKFRQFESTSSSPPQSPGRRKEFTPPRDDDRSHQVLVVESTPEFKPDIVHSTDPLEEALPERGMAKNIAQMFRQMEAGTKSPTSPKAKKEFTPPPRDSGVYENQPKQFHAEYNRPAESGVLENQPLRRDDVVRGDEPPKYEEELPERGAAKNLVSKWRQMESESAKLKSPSSGGRPKEFTPPREEPRIVQYKKSPRTPMSPGSYGQLDNGSVHPSDLPGQYQPQSEESVSESSPEHRSDVIREADTDWQDGLPKKDTAKKMLARFQSIQAEASKPGQVQASRKDSESSETAYFEDMDNEKQNCEDENKVGRSKSMRAAIQTEKCGACDKTVYAMERLEMNKRVYHKACFRCNQCKAVLTPKTFAINNEVIFCTTHYKQLFATKGNYDEGFGRTQHKKRWSSNPNLAKDTDEDSAS